MFARRAAPVRSVALAGALILAAFVVPGPVSRAVADDGTWQELGETGAIPTARLAHSAAYDPVTRRMVIFGGAEAIRETYELSLGVSPPTWLSLTTLPSGRKGASLVTDPIRHRMLMFGGYDVNWRNDLWALSLDANPEWTQVVASGQPPPVRLLHIAAYDPNHDRMLVMGGLEGGAYNDVWTLNLAGTPTWQPVVAGGDPPPARYGHVGIYDPRRDRLVIWGASSDRAVWTLDFTPSPVWTRHDVPNAPPNLYYASAVYDPVWDRMVVFGGSTNLSSAQPSNVTFELQLGDLAWRTMIPGGTPPSARFLQTAVYDPTVNRMLVYGGYGTDWKTYALQWAPPPSGPQILSFTPHGGQPGDPVTLLGVSLQNTTSIQFNGVEAPLLSVSEFQLDTQVPDGATTGPISITTPQGSATTDSVFYIGFRPVVTSVEPDSGHVGDRVVIHGAYFSNPLEVGLGIGTAPFTFVSDSRIETVVDRNSSTGMVHVRTVLGANSTGPDFHMLSPDSLPHIVSIRDVRKDQGGKVTIKWRGSDYDGAYRTTVSSYRVWRRAPADAAARAASAARLERRVAPDGVTMEYWEPIATLPASQLPGYAYTAATVRDSMPDDNPFTAFLVQAVVSGTLSYWSGADSAYSVDDLAPPQPGPFAGVYGSYAVALHWVASDAPDLYGYRLYAGPGPSFVPGPGNLVVATRDTAYNDTAFDPERLYYKLSAVDVHGNESRYALVSPNGATGTLAAFVAAETAPDRVDVTWAAIATPTLQATVERRAPGADWTPVADVAADGSGLLRYHDADVLPGQRYGYRLAIVDDDRTIVVGETWVEVPAFALALGAVRPNPSTGEVVRLALTMAPGAPVRLDVLDIAGRVVARRTLDAEPSGRAEVALDAARWPAGVYLARLSQAGRVAIRRFVVAP